MNESKRIGRPPIEGGPRKDFLVTLSEAERTVIDYARGETPRAKFIRDAALVRALELVSEAVKP